MPGVAVRWRLCKKGNEEESNRIGRKRKEIWRVSLGQIWVSWKFVRTPEERRRNRTNLCPLDLTTPKRRSIFNIELIRHLSTIAFPCSIIGTLIIPNSLMAFDQLSCRPPARIPAIDV